MPSLRENRIEDARSTAQTSSTYVLVGTERFARKRQACRLLAGVTVDAFEAYTRILKAVADGHVRVLRAGPRLHLYAAADVQALADRLRDA